jgi:FtsP/CotA-like multicopper oxidase with cupredoxin domain
MILRRELISALVLQERIDRVVVYKKMVALGIGLVSILLLLIASALVHVAAQRRYVPSQAAPLPQPQVRNFQLYVRDNMVTMPDKKQIWIFGYTANPDGSAQLPGPTLVVNQGDTVNVTLNNYHDPTISPADPDGDGHTIHFHGLDLPDAEDGDPMTAPGGQGVMQGDSYTYHFVATDAGTYWYHCHVNAAEHIQMGMYGALIVQPRGEPMRAYAGTPTFDKEYTFVLSDMDSNAHAITYKHITASGAAFNWTQYRPNYFLINGKAWPDTLKDPADTIVATVGQTVLVRLINAGYAVHAMHSHGYHFTVIGTDGRALAHPYEKDTLEIAPGETYEILFHFDHPGRFMFHDHFEQDTTNNGVYPGGMMTMITVNNPNGSNPTLLPRGMSGMGK